MIPVLEERLGLGGEVVHQFGDAADDPQRAESGLGSVSTEAGKKVSPGLTFFRMYVLLLPRSFSTSLARSRDISSDEMFAKVHSARPTAYMFEWFISLG